MHEKDYHRKQFQTIIKQVFTFSKRYNTHGQEQRTH